MASLSDVERFVRAEQGLAVISVVAGSGASARPASSLVNVGVAEHPVTGEAVVAFVARASARKVAHLRANPNATVTISTSWRWVGVSGPVELAGPDDPLDGLAADDVPGLLRAVFRAAGGVHDDWDEYDRVMADERRLAVLVGPRRVYGNP